jgi:hypothetical protein
MLCCCEHALLSLPTSSATRFGSTWLSHPTTAPGGTIEADGAELNPYSCFQTEDNHDALATQADIIRKLVRRYKYLEPSLEEAFARFAKYLNGFEEENMFKLAKTTAILLSMGLITAKPLLGMCEIESIVSTGLARTFMTTMFATWVKVATNSQISTALRKGGLNGQKMQIFFPQNERTVQHIVDHLGAVAGLKPVPLLLDSAFSLPFVSS